MRQNDTVHILQDIRLKRYEGEEEPKLYRFKNAAGDKISAIYLGDFEYGWTYTDGEPGEAEMIRDWNNRDGKEI